MHSSDSHGKRVETPAIVRRYSFAGLAIAVGALLLGYWWWSATESSVSIRPQLMLLVSGLSDSQRREVSRTFEFLGIRREERDLSQNLDRNASFLVGSIDGTRVFANSRAWHAALAKNNAADTPPALHPGLKLTPTSLATLVDADIESISLMKAEEYLARERIAVSGDVTRELAGYLTEYALIEAAFRKYSPQAITWSIEFTPPADHTRTSLEEKQQVGMLRILAVKVQGLRKDSNVRCFWRIQDPP